ncbi:MAG: tetratricopeptide repeat protein [Thermodesulfovibrionales bacterium]|nr:tetratricopeptide repeat protein [Thermodesulfovibrionales bacterium]
MIFKNYSKIIILIILFFLYGCLSFPRIIEVRDKLPADELIALGVIYERKGLYEEALKEYYAASKSEPVAFLYIGNVYFLKKDYEKAEQYYRKAIEHVPDFADAYNNLAWLYYVQDKNLDEAEFFIEKALEFKPMKRDVYIDTLEKIKELKSLKK